LTHRSLIHNFSEHLDTSLFTPGKIGSVPPTAPNLKVALRIFGTFPDHHQASRWPVFARGQAFLEM
jgi:hypothetical protein